MDNCLLQVSAPVTMGYHVKYYTKDVLPFSPILRHERFFSTKEKADTFMNSIITESGLPNPTCNPIYAVTIMGELYAVTKIPSNLCDVTD